MSSITVREIQIPPSECVVVDVTYTELVELMFTEALDVCSLYRITDFQTLHKIPGTTDRNDTNTTIPVEVLVVKPASSSTIFDQVKSESFPDDIIYYTTDNTAWKDLQIAGQKGCITLRIDPVRNIDVGNGDWRNYIIRRWAADLSAFGDDAIRWVLWAASVNCGITNTGTTQTFTALDTNLYNAVTNPDGYKDVRLFLPASGRGAINVYIKCSADDNTVFLMPNFYLEVTAGTNTLNNVFLPECKNLTITNEWYSVNIKTVRECIFTRVLSYRNCADGYFENSFIALNNRYAPINFINIIACTIFTLDEQDGHAFGLFTNLNNCHIQLLTGAGTYQPWNYLTLENVYFIRAKIQRARPMMFKINDMAYNGIIDNNFTYIFKDISAQTTNIIYNPAAQSTIQTTLAAVSALVLASTPGTATVIDIFAGIINLTGSGTVNIDTLTRYLSNNFPITLKPAAGLIIRIDQNNVANGFVNKDVVTANGTNGEVIILTPVGDRWSAQGNKIGEIATNNPADPATTNSTIGVMMGLAVSFTPTKSGNTMVVISGDIDNDTASDGSQVQIRFGTGAAPANGTALTGTQAGGLIKMLNSDATTPGRVPFTCTSLLPLTVGVANWVDVSLASITGGISRIRDISATLIEQ